MTIGEAKLEEFFNHLSLQVAGRKYVAELRSRASDDCEAIHLPPSRTETDPAAEQHPLAAFSLQSLRSVKD